MLTLTDNHAPRLALMSPALVELAIRNEVEAGVEVIVEDARASILEGAISGPGHQPSLPGEPPNADSHELDLSLHATAVVETPGEIKVSAVADAEHAVYQELGTTRMEPRPFLAPASIRNRDAIIRSLRQRLRDERS